MGDPFKQYKKVEKLKAKRDVKGFIKMLRSKELTDRSDAIRGLKEIGDPRAVEPLMKVLSDENSNMRHEAADALGSLRDPRAEDVLIRLLAVDSDASVRFSAAHALGYIGDPRAVDVLLETFKQHSPGSTHPEWAAADALSMIGGPVVVDGILKAIKDIPDEERLTWNRESSSRWEYLVAKGFEIIGKIGGDHTVDLLIDFVCDTGSGWGRGRAVRALDQAGGAKADDFLDNRMLRSKEAWGSNEGGEVTRMLNNLDGGQAEQPAQA